MLHARRSRVTPRPLPAVSSPSHFHVSWRGLTCYVLKDPVKSSVDQIKAFTNIPGFSHTNRPLQSKGTRTVKLDNSP